MITKEEFKKILVKYKRENIEFGKDLNYLCFRNSGSKEEFIDEIFSLENLELINKQERNKEERFALYFIYSKSKGRVYVLRFYLENIRVVTIFPIGKKTLNKYFKRKLKKEKNP